MNRNSVSFLSRACGNQRGQVLPLVALLMTVLLGMAGLAVDVGLAYVSSRELQASTDAAALAGAHDLPNTSATTTATSYSGVAGNKNAQANLPNVTMVSGYPKLECLSTLTNEAIPCVAPANANAIVVKQQVNVATGFARVFGFNSFSLTATATAAMRGSSVGPYNVVIIVDTTQSMNNNDNDSGSNCTNSRISCALSGVQTLLSGLQPCPAKSSSCGTITNGNVANAVDTVGLMTFPGLTASNQVPYEYCGDTRPAPQVQNYNNSPIYSIIPFSSDYRTSDTATSLNSSSNIVLSSGGTRSCSGLDVVGGVGTFYAGVIDAAQAALVAAQASRPNSQNVMILLSDGDANASRTDMGTGAGTYPYTQECHQAITEAQKATAAGTTVYAVAYGTGSSGCSTDTSPSITPCQTMQQIASSALTFFSDGGSSRNACVSASRPTTNLDQIFAEILTNFSNPRLIPDNTP